MSEEKNKQVRVEDEVRKEPPQPQPQPQTTDYSLCNISLVGIYYNGIDNCSLLDILHNSVYIYPSTVSFLNKAVL
jgi:hypothetical protein